MIGGADGLHRILKVTVLGITGGRVRLGFEVDPSVPVHRGEIWERINVNEQLNSPTEARAKLDEVGRSSAEAWKDVQKGVQSAWDDLDKAFRKASREF